MCRCRSRHRSNYGFLMHFYYVQNALMPLNSDAKRAASRPCPSMISPAWHHSPWLRAHRSAILCSVAMRRSSALQLRSGRPLARNNARRSAGLSPVVRCVVGGHVVHHGKEKPARRFDAHDLRSECSIRHEAANHAKHNKYAVCKGSE
jgi:hypothetical protein